MSEFQRKIIIRSEYGQQEFPYERPVITYINMYNRRLTIGGLETIPFPPTSYLEIQIIEKENIAKLPKKDKEKQYIYNKVGPLPIKEPIRMHDQVPEVSSTSNEEPPPPKKQKSEHSITYHDTNKHVYNKITKILNEKYNENFQLPYTPENATVAKQYLLDNIARNYPKDDQGVHDSHAEYMTLLHELHQSASKNI